MKLSDAKRDYYRISAKNEGYRSRSAYKLKQINDSYRILKPSDKAIDLGCAPGGWLQVILKQVGPSGQAIGVDIHEVQPIEGAAILQGDIEDPDISNRLSELMNSKADVVVSDLAPNITGIWSVDHARQMSLNRNAYSIVQKVLRKGGIAIFKIFEGELVNQFKMELKVSFENVVLSKPHASRQKSSEFYFICFKYNG
jgi:23S rRNA (uridine2552-2'-O)-methyltransferase